MHYLCTNKQKIIIIILRLNIMRTKIENFLSNLDTAITVLDFVDIDSIDPVNPFGSIYEMIEENDGFDIDIVYYSDAINYLSDNDPSLHESLKLASEYGFEVQNLSSEILASLLASQTEREEFNELEDEINDFFEELEEEEEDEWLNPDNILADYEEWLNPKQ